MNAFLSSHRLIWGLPQYSNDYREYQSHLALFAGEKIQLLDDFAEDKVHLGVVDFNHKLSSKEVLLH